MLVVDERGQGISLLHSHSTGFWFQQGETDDYCTCQNVPDRTTLAKRAAEKIYADQDAQVAGEG
jgi:hypothetical protein